MDGDEKHRHVQLLLAAAVPQERIAEPTGVSVRAIRRIAREPVEPAAPRPRAQPRRSAPMPRLDPIARFIRSELHKRSPVSIGIRLPQSRFTTNSEWSTAAGLRFPKATSARALPQ